ncbi:type 2 lantipeptide synthetase LanM family protein [Clostridium sp. YIM B02505]|uniref:Type 2 lantipeptide synthetase LanM family protein n=1 Tax=Clostridium yunnanense TaxID=2800325 RepID=A0ABS1EWM6_9CLOT|nr:type 2 lanthipeptide synthetase LanM family protein [Clostridium yunnanense]MBK1813745.1 type 2 lantipeptide synthetase LanM family protein [Clostridium yunnanense]
MEITTQDVKKYWLKIVPEASNEDKLRELTKKVSECDIDNLADALLNKEIIDENFNDILNEERFDRLDQFVSEFRNTIPFFFFYEPYINLCLKKWVALISELDLVYNIEKFFNECIYSLLQQLSSYASRVLILEVNIARMDKKLKGNTDRARFEYFHFSVLNDKKYLSNLYSEYKELTKIMRVKSEHYFEFIYEVLTNIKNNLDDISLVYERNIKELKIESIKTGMGDEHHSGKTVTKIEFINGFKLMYKPRNLKMDIGFQSILEWIEKKEKTNILPIKKLKIINKIDFGLVGYVDNNECKSIKEVEEFYKRMGQLIAILHSLNAVDFHCENIIADGANPMLIDLETLFHPYVKVHYDGYETESQKMANTVIENSVQSIGILPYYLMNEENSDAMLDISGLGGATDQKSPFKSYVIKDQNTDHVEVIREHLKMEPEKNNPKLNGMIQKSECFIDNLIDGFKTSYNVILANKEQYYDLIKDIFEGSINRIILRPTRDYTQLLNTSYHPDLLRNYEDRVVFFSRIGSNIDEDKNDIVKLEFNSLLNTEVPCFNCKLNCRNIYDMRGNEYINFLTETPLDTVYKRIMSFSKEDLNLQLRIIEIAFKSKENDYDKDKTPISFDKLRGKKTSIDTTKYIDLAVEIGNYILENSILDSSDKNNRTWVSAILSGRNEVGVGISPIGDDLYNGNGGIALFLIYLGFVTGKEEFIKAASEALESRRKFIDNAPRNHPFSIGAFNGLSGTIYVFDKLVRYSGVESDKKYIEKYIRYLDDIVLMDKQYDLIGGSVGCIAVLLPMIKANNYPELDSIMKSIVNKCCKHLINEKESTDIGGVAWGHIMKSTGFSHGNAGVIAYLSQLLEECWIENTSDLKVVIKEALEFERALYIKEEDNWFKTNKKEEIAFGWCHGAPGILLSKCLTKFSSFDDNNLDQEIKSALVTTRRKSFGNNPSLCHGDLGNLEILYIAAEKLMDNKLKDECKMIFDDIYEQVITQRWKGKSFRGVESYSLMVGLAGFGYSLLRFSAPDAIPSVLFLE